MNDESYQYINDEMTGGTVLSTRLAWCLDHPRDQVEVYVCLYRIVKKKRGARGFLSFLMEKVGDQYTMPSFIHSCADDVEDVVDEDEDDDAVDNSLKGKCIQTLVDVRYLQQDLATNAQTTLGYKGLVANGNVVFALFNADELEQTFSKSSPKSRGRCLWVILDEILRRNSVNGVPVDPVIIDMFVRNPILGKLNVAGKPIDPPRQLYLVVVNPETEEPRCHQRGCRNAVMELPHRFAHQFDKRYLLTETPLSSPAASSGESEWIRYAAFIDKPTYVFDRETATPEKRTHYADLINKYSHALEINKDDEDDRIELHRNIPCISFTDRIGSHPPVDVWGVNHRRQFVDIDED